MARNDQNRLCGGLLKLNVAVLFTGIVDTVVAVSYLVSIASIVSRRSSIDEPISITELTTRCFVSIVSFTAVFLLSLGIMTKSPWLLIVHMAKSVLLASTFGLKSTVDIYEIIQKQNFQLVPGLITLFIGIYALTEGWFFCVIHKAYSRLMNDSEDGSTTSTENVRIIVEDVGSKKLKSTEIDRLRPCGETGKIRKNVMVRVPASTRSHPNCYYEVPINAIANPKNLETDCLVVHKNRKNNMLKISTTAHSV